MARDFSTRTDTDKTDLAKYPDGRIKDGITDGTKAGEEVVGDFQQVFLKAMRDAGITPNGLPDNEINGWQMFDACFGTAKVPITSFGTYCANTEYATERPLSVWKENGGKTLRINGHIAINSGVVDNQTVFSLPSGYRPSFDFTDFAIGVSANQLDQKLNYDSTTFNVLLKGVVGGTPRQYINWSIPLD